MDANDLHPTDDWSHRFFIWHEWIQANGPLTTENAFEYFATSMFYDKQSNNQVLRMQTVHTGKPIVNEAEELKRFTGIEFAIVHAQPPSLFIIHKRERFSPDDVRPLAAYFIINNRIYQSPDVYTVLSNRLLTSLYSMQSSLDILRKYRPDYTARTGFAWPVMMPEETSKKRRADGVAAPTDSQTPGASQPEPSEPNMPADTSRPSAPQAVDKEKAAVTASAKSKHQNLILLLNAMRTTAAHSNKAFALQMEQAASERTAVDEHMSASSSVPSTLPTSTATPQAASSAAATAEVPVVKAPQGAGKKKKKRMSIPAPGNS